MPNSSALKEAANNLIVAARQFIEAVEAEESASADAVPAHMVNVPPETRAVRPSLAHTDPHTAEVSAPINASKTAASAAISAESDASKTADASASASKKAS